MTPTPKPSPLDDAEPLDEGTKVYVPEPPDHLTDDEQRLWELVTSDPGRLVEGGIMLPLLSEVARLRAIEDERKHDAWERDLLD